MSYTKGQKLVCVSDGDWTTLDEGFIAPGPKYEQDVLVEDITQSECYNMESASS